MASSRKGAITLAALMLLAGCGADAGKAHQAVEANPSEAAIRAFSAALAHDRYTYDEYLGRFSSSPHARHLRFDGNPVLAIDIPLLGSCFPRDNRHDVFAQPPQAGRSRQVDEFRCIVDHNEVSFSSLRSFGLGIFETPDEGAPLARVEDLHLPVGNHAALVGFERQPATCVRMEVVVTSDVDIFEIALRASGRPILSEAVLHQIGDHITVRRIRFLIDDFPQCYTESGDVLR